MNCIYGRQRTVERNRKTSYKDKLKDALKIAKSADFTELNKGYDRTYKQLDYLGMCVGEETTQNIAMKYPRKCSYSKQKYDRATRQHQEYTIVLENPPVKKNRVYDKKTKKYVTTSGTPPIPPIEHRAITLKQLRALEANIRRRCVIEGWTNYEGKPLKAEEVTVYDADRYVIRPYTVATRQSFVTCLPSTNGYQRPRWVASHWWGQPIIELIHCLEQFVRDFRTNHYDNDGRRGGGMTDETPIWIWAFANNPWTSLKYNLDDHILSGISKALKVANSRTVTIVDKKGAIFHRIWCMYEMSLTLINRQPGERISAVYTAHKHTFIEPDFGAEEDRDAIGIIAGGTTSDGGHIPSITAREKFFPFELITKSLSINVQEAKATKDSDRIHILNSIIGNSGDMITNKPPEAHAQYNAVNDVLRRRFSEQQQTVTLDLKQT